MFTSITDDVRYAWHSLRSTPWLVGVAVVILALAIGVNAGMFSVIDALLLKHLAIRNPSELVAISMTDPSGARRKLSVPITIALAERQQVFSGTIAWVGDLVVNVDAGGQLGLGNVWATTGNFHEELGQTPILGRLFDDKNFTLGSTAETDVAIIGHSFWERRYGADPRAIGSEIRIEGRPFTVIGVTQKWFTGMALGIAPDVTVLLAALPAINQALGLSRAIEDPGSFEVDMAGRIKAGATPAQAQAQLESFWSDVLFAAAPSGLTTQQRDEFLSVRVRVESAARGVGREDRSRLVAPLFPLLVTRSHCVHCRVFASRTRDGGTRRESPPAHRDSRRTRCNQVSASSSGRHRGSHRVGDRRRGGTTLCDLGERNFDTTPATERRVAAVRRPVARCVCRCLGHRMFGARCYSLQCGHVVDQYARRADGCASASCTGPSRFNWMVG